MTKSQAPQQEVDLRPAENSARANGCASDLALDALVDSVWQASAPPSVDAALAAVRSFAPPHVFSCAHCEGRLRLLLAAQQEALPSVARILAQARAQLAQEEKQEAVDLEPSSAPGVLNRLSRWWSAVPVTVAAAAAIAFVAWPAPVSPPKATGGGGAHAVAIDPRVDAIRAKGTAVRFFVKRGDEVSLGRSGDRFLEGDALRFVVTSGAPSNLLVFGVSADGSVSAYYPFGGSESQPLDVGAEIPLPGSLVLDGARETEFIGAIFSPEPVLLETLAQNIGAAVKAAEFIPSGKVAPSTPDGTVRERGVVEMGLLKALDLKGAVHWIELNKVAIPSHGSDDGEEAK